LGLVDGRSGKGNHQPQSCGVPMDGSLGIAELSLGGLGIVRNQCMDDTVIGTGPKAIKRSIQLHENGYLVWDQKFGDPTQRY